MREQGKLNTARLLRCALFAGAAIIIYAVESCIPPVVAIPGIKPGLANVVTLSAVYLLGSYDAFAILIVRIILSNLLTGQAVSLIYSLAGGLLCFGVTVLLKPFFSGKTIWVLGVIGAVFHNLGQLVCAYFMLGGASVLYYGFVLTASSCITGTFTGFCAQSAVIHGKKILRL